MIRPTASRQHWRPLLIFAGLAVMLTIWQHQAGGGGTSSLPEHLGRALTYPAVRRFTALHGVIYDVGVSVLRAPAIAVENRDLRQQRDRLLAEKALSTEYFLENKRIKEKLGLSVEQQVKEIPALVIARPPGGQVTIGVPSGREIHVGDVIREAQGLVGRVVEVQGTTAQVILLIDRHHALSARDQRSRDEGMVYPEQTWSGNPRRLRMEKLLQRADLRTGDVILTSGLDKVYPPNIPIGTVESVRRSPASVEAITAIIKPFVDFDRLDYVWVVSQP